MSPSDPKSPRESFQFTWQS